MRIAIVANGNLPKEFLGELKKADLVIGIDRAAYWLIKHGIISAIAIGDFDATSRGELAVIKKNVSTIKIFSPEKDFTDTELALRYAIRRKPSHIIIYGGNGTRMDHVLATLFLLEKCVKRGISVIFRDKTNEITVVSRGRTILKKRAGYTYVSIVPISPSIVVTLRKFKYNITNKTIHRGQTLGISNEFTTRQAEVTIHRGLALVVQSRD